MRKLTIPVVAVCLVVLAFSCKKELTKQTEVLTEEIAQETLAKIRNLGFSSHEVKKVDGGYLVEGDILLSEEELNSTPGSPNMLIAEEEHYHTFNLVNPAKYPTIRVALNNSSSAHQNAFLAALNEAIKRYNALGLQIRFQRVTSSAHISVVAFYENSNILGSAGFPTSTGAPYSQVRMNTFHYSTSTSASNVNYIATIIAHEIGHCIGFRHTDYMDRAYSCGYYGGGNEGQTTSGIGAIHIPGTPTGPNANSWMLACIANGVNRPFNSNDKVALKYVY